MKVQVTVDNRIRIDLREWRDDPGMSGVLELLKQDFTHVNPQREMLRRIGKPHWGEPKTIETWHQDDEQLSLPRGGMDRVRRRLEEAGLARRVVDDRERGDPAGEDLPDHRLQLYPYQEKAVQAALRQECGIIRAPTGCLTGDTIVTINRAGKSGTMRLDHVVHMFNGGGAAMARGNGLGRPWRTEIPTFVRAPFPDGTVHLARVTGAWVRGSKPVYRVSLAGGWRLNATACHRFMTPSGWRRLDDLSIGDQVLVDVGMGGAEHKRKPWYKLRTLREHPYAGRRGVKPEKGGWTVPVHRLVAEARENGMELEEFVESVRRTYHDLTPLKFLDPKVWVVHHRDHNPHNNAPENLEVMTHEEHRRQHRGEHLRNIASRLAPRALLAVEYQGERETYDLTVERTEAFVANGIAVHNSGKTCVGFALVGRIKVATLIIVYNTGLFDQWVKRAQKELGMRAEDIGCIRGSKFKLRPLTIAMQQSINARGVDEKLASYFGMVIVDEVQRAAARTMFGAVDPFAARYRFGISADQRRKDKKEFLTQDLFGGVIEDIKRSDLIKSGHVLDVQVRVVPTDFSAPWYGMASEDEPDLELDTVRLTAEIADDVGRNELVLAAVMNEVEDEQVLVFSHRREHCLVIDRRLVMMGVRTGFLIGGEDYRQEFVKSVAGVEQGSIRVGVGTYQAVGQAIDLPGVSVGVAATPIAANRQVFNQVRGRLCRVAAGKKSARLYYLWDKQVFGRRHLENLVQWNADVVVQENGSWVPAREYLKSL